MNQMQKTLVTLGGLLVVAGALGVVAYKSVYEKDEAAAKKKAIEERLLATEDAKKAADGGVAKIDFTRLTVIAKGETTVLEKAEGKAWRLVSPLAAKADPLVMDALLSQLQSSRFKTTLEGEATDAELKSYGLDQPSFSVEAEAIVDGAPRTVKLEGGIENPFDGTVYMRRDGSRTVHMAEGGVRWSFAKTTFDLRDKEVFALDEQKLKTLALTSKNNEWAVARGDDKLWRLTRPEASLADAVQIGAILGALHGERAVGFPGEPTPERLQALGLDHPTATLTCELETGTVSFSLSTVKSDAGEAFYVLRDDASGRTLAEVTANPRKDIDRNFVDLRDKSLLPFAKQAVTKITVAAPDKPLLTIERDPGTASVESWKVTSPRTGPAKAYKVASTLWTLAGLKAQTVVVDKPDAKVLETYGVTPKQARVISLFDQSGKALATLTVGKELIGKTGSSYAVGLRPPIVEIDTSHFNELPWTAEDVLEVPSADAGH